MRAKEFIIEGGWVDVQTQGTVITPALTAKVMKTLLSNFIPSLNKFLVTKGLGETEISSPGGSATYYKRDLEQDPTREYGDIDVQFHIPKMPNISDAQNETVYKEAIKEFCQRDPNYSTKNGVNLILSLGSGKFVQIDLIFSYFDNKQWIQTLVPEYRVKGVLCNSLYSALGEALNISFGGGRGIQVKTKNGEVVPFRTMKDVVLRTITNDPKNWAIDIVQYFGAKNISPQLKKYPGTLDEVRVADIIQSFKGIAETLEVSGKIQSAQELLGQVKSIYLAKIEKAAASSKFDKVASPEAAAKAEKTKQMLLTKSQEFATLF